MKNLIIRWLGLGQVSIKINEWTDEKVIKTVSLKGLKCKKVF